MTKLARKLRRKKIKQLKKDTRNRLRKVERSIEDMPSECGTCGKSFENEDTEKWAIKIDLDGASMTCPTCREASYESQDQES